MKYVIVGCLLLILGTIGLGIYYYLQDNIAVANRKLKIVLGANLSIYIPLLAFTVLLMLPINALASPETTSASATGNASGLGFISAALSTGLATLAAGYAVGSVGSSALGAVSENPKILGKTLIFVGLAEGIAIYGLIVSILILGKL